MMGPTGDEFKIVALHRDGRAQGSNQFQTFTPPWRAHAPERCAPAQLEPSLQVAWLPAAGVPLFAMKRPRASRAGPAAVVAGLAAPTAAGAADDAPLGVAPAALAVVGAAVAIACAGAVAVTAPDFVAGGVAACAVTAGFAVGVAVVAAVGVAVCVACAEASTGNSRTAASDSNEREGVRVMAISRGR